MPLVSSTTNLKSLRFGKDRPGGGSSNQPYITKSIPDGDPSNIFNTGGPDFLIRGGLIAPLSAANDVSRLTQMFFDLKSPNGLLFTAKQNLLSRTAVKTEASKGLGYGGGNVNAGIYTPISTILQAGVGFTGTHLNLLGLDPTDPTSGVVQGSLFPGLGLNRYTQVVDQNNTEQSNRLVLLTKSKIYNSNFFPDQQVSVDPSTGIAEDSLEILNYSGGPGSILGIGDTKIKFATTPSFANSARTSDVKKPSNRKNIPLRKDLIFSSSGSVSRLYNQLTGVDLFGSQFNLDEGDQGFRNFQTNVYTPFSAGTFPENSDRIYDNNTYVLTQEQLINKTGVNKNLGINLNPQDFRKTIIENNPEISDTETSTVLSLSPDYQRKAMTKRLNMGDPGRRNNVYNYGIPANQTDALDKITALPMYEGAGPNTSLAINDLVKFRIAAINNDSDDGAAVYMHFRAFIDSFTDNYNATWNSVQYVGRGDSLANYGGFTRNIGMGFTVFAQSKAELIPMYKKLNYLASTLTPDYTNAGFMRGNLVRLTMGGYIYEQPGYFTSLNYTIPQESPWEIAINEQGGSDSSVKELPHMVQVSLDFTPIHNFLPQKPNVANNPNERYIALANAFNSRGNYNDSYKLYQADGDGDNNNTNNIPGE